MSTRDLQRAWLRELGKPSRDCPIANPFALVPLGGVFAAVGVGLLFLVGLAARPIRRHGPTQGLPGETTALLVALSTLLIVQWPVVLLRRWRLLCRGHATMGRLESAYSSSNRGGSFLNVTVSFADQAGRSHTLSGTGIDSVVQATPREPGAEVAVVYDPRNPRHAIVPSLVYPGTDPEG